jgi:hypothetical protein
MTVTLLANRGTVPSLWLLAKLAMGWDGFIHSDFRSSLSLPASFHSHRYYAIIHGLSHSPGPSPPPYFSPFPSDDDMGEGDDDLDDADAAAVDAPQDALDDMHEADDEADDQ